MSRSILKYVGGFLLCILANAVVDGLASELGVFKVNPQTHIPLPTSQTPLMSIWYCLVVIILYGAWSLYVPVLLIFHVSAKYLKSCDYGSFIVLSTLIWSFCGLIFGLIPKFSSLVLSYSVVGAAYGYYYRAWLFDQPETE
jgi:hypothetical protein